MDMLPVASSMISAVGYDPDAQKLEVQFTNGSTYTYGGVPQSDFDAMMSAQSVGKFFIANIKHQYRVE